LFINIQCWDFVLCFVLMRRLELYGNLRTDSESLAWCRQHGVLAVSMLCPVCGQLMTEVSDKCEDGSIWSCRRWYQGRRHQRKISIRHGSFFSGRKTTIINVLYALYEWSVKAGVEQTAYELQMCRKTIRDLFKGFRGLASQAILSQLSAPIGGTGTITEIDECQLGRRKHYRGRAPTEVWVFGGVVRGSSPFRCFLRTVQRRNRRTLEPIIQQSINMEGRLISDDWGAYRHLQAIGYDHSIVQHCDNFVDPQDVTIHTQNIENLWRCLRRFLATKGTYTRRNLQGYLDEFVFRKHAVDPFECILSMMITENGV